MDGSTRYLRWEGNPVPEVIERASILSTASCATIESSLTAAIVPLFIAYEKGVFWNLLHEHYTSPQNHIAKRLKCCPRWIGIGGVF